MRAWLIVIAAVLLWIACPNAPVRAADSQAPPSDQAVSATLPVGQVNGAPLDGYLRKLGNQLDCHFTIESKYRSDAEVAAMKQDFTLGYIGVSIALRTDLILSAPPVTSFTSVGQAVAQLGALLPQAKVFQDPNTANVIHVVDAALMAEPGYVMDRTGDFAYTGRLGDLPDPWAKHSKVSAIAVSRTVRSSLATL